MNDVTLDRETAELLPVPVYADGVLTTDFDVTITRWPARPTDWQPAAIESGVAGIVVAGLTPGTYQVWVRQESTVVPAGTVEVR